ncbi:MAG: hypothetical protein AAFR13_05755 [Pseudomonadota bacterium]
MSLPYLLVSASGRGTTALLQAPIEAVVFAMLAVALLGLPILFVGGSLLVVYRSTLHQSRGFTLFHSLALGVVAALPFALLLGDAANREFAALSLLCGLIGGAVYFKLVSGRWW